MAEEDGWDRPASGVRAGGCSGRIRSEPEGAGVVPEPYEPERPDLLGRPELDGPEALDLGQGMGRRRRCARRGACTTRARLRQGLACPPTPTSPLAPRSTATGFTFNLGVFLLLVCGIAVMYGSVGEWVHISGSLGIANFHVSYNGIDPGISTLIGVNGWVTFIGGILLVIFACFEMTSEEQLLGVFTTLIAAATAVFAIYDMFRIVQKISQVPASVSADVSVGWGLICVLSAAVLATLIAIVRLLQR